MGQGVSTGLSPRSDPECWDPLPFSMSQGKGCGQAQGGQKCHTGGDTEQARGLAGCWRATLWGWVSGQEEGAADHHPHPSGPQ